MAEVSAIPKLDRLQLSWRAPLRLAGWPLFLVWLSFILRGTFYCCAFPIFEGFDEYGHFAVIQHIFFHHDIPRPQVTDSSHEIADSLRLVPVPWLLHDASKGLLSFEDYWRISPQERARRQRELRNIPPSYAVEDAKPALPLYEAQQAPLYYWLLLPVYWAVKSAQLPTQLWALRWVTMLVTSIAIPVAFAIAKRFFSDECVSLGVAVVTASMPQLAIDGFRISNEGLCIALGSLAVLAVVRLWDAPPNPIRGVIAGVVIGAALLTKAYFLVLLPWTAIVLVALLRYRLRRRAAICQLVIVFGTVAGLAGWYYLRVFALSGTLTGEQNDVAAQMSHLSVVEAITAIHWLRVFDVIAISHIWLGNWSFIVVRSWMYQGIELAYLAGLCGIILQLVAPRDSLPKARRIVVLAAPYLFLLLGLCFHVIQSFRASGNAGSMGYYLLCLVVPEVILLCVGLFRLLPDARRVWTVPLLTLLFNAVEQFGTTFYLLPYYAGMIQHDGRGHLPTLRVSQLAHGGVSRLFENLAANKPAFLSPFELEVMMTLSFGACLTLVSLACLVALWRPNVRETLG